MRLNFLHLQAYGVLEDRTLHLGDGLNVVHGLNETGKSTLLCAYADLLCGIPPNTSMGFLFGRAKLRIHASAVLDDGSTAKVIRTSKKAPHDLLNTQTSRPVPEDLRRALTQAIDHNSVMNRFGLDHGRVVAGGQALINGEGDLADIVFEARSGTDVRLLVDRLEKRMIELYRPHRSSRSQLIRADAIREARASALTDKMATAEAVEAAAARLKRLEADLERRRLHATQVRTEHTRLNQLVGSWPYWEQYRVHRDELVQAESAGQRLSSDQFEIVIAAIARMNEIQDEIRREDITAEAAQRERAGLAINDVLLAAQPAIDTLARDRPSAETARARNLQLRVQAKSTSHELQLALERLGVRGNDDPLAAHRSIAVADDRLADLNSLANQSDRLEEELHKAQHAVREAASQLDAIMGGNVSTSVQVGSDEEGEPSSVAATRTHRDLLWSHVRSSWLDGTKIPAEFYSCPTDLADSYGMSVQEADNAADTQAILAASNATANERRRALAGTQRSLDQAKQQLASWQISWAKATNAAGLPQGLGVPGWRERVALLSDARRIADSFRNLEIGAAENAVIVASWESSAAALAKLLGLTIQPDQLAAWFANIEEAYEQSKSNQMAAQVHDRNQSVAVERAARLREEVAALEKSLERVTHENGVDRLGLAVLVERTESYDAVVAALAEPQGQLRARHPDTTLEELTRQLADRNRELLIVDVDATRDALDTAEEAVSAAQEHVIGARRALGELTGRTGANELKQELSQSTAEVLDMIEEYATIRLMHHLLTKELRAYLDLHENPLLERAGAYLARLTQGRFVALRAAGEGTKRSLVVVGADDADYETSTLSEGTASQLYLALSLAGALEVEQERREAGEETIPIMLDDVLMTFDDERAASALDLLEEIGRSLQIVLFTHHASVIERACELGDSVRRIKMAAL